LGGKSELIGSGINDRHTPKINYDIFRLGNKICYVANNDGYYVIDANLTIPQYIKLDDPHIEHIKMGLTY
jgi:hypothetical protein